MAKPAAYDGTYNSTKCLLPWSLRFARIELTSGLSVVSDLVTAKIVFVHFLLTKGLIVSTAELNGVVPLFLCALCAFLWLKPVLSFL